MKNADQLKAMVRERYDKIANQETEVNASSCCGATTSSNKVYNIMMDSYDDMEGYNSDADLGLGCGLPTQFAKILPGHTVIDLGSGAGNDCFVARHEVGATGKVIGVDFSEPMISKARQNAEKLGFNNVEFRYGDIDNMPVNDHVADVVVSNCVLNLVPDKAHVIQEIHRVLKPGGHFSISDIVLVGDLPEGLRQSAEMYAGCVAGAIQKSEYLSLVHQTGFQNVTIQKEKTINIPDDILSQYLGQEQIKSFNAGNTGIFSITVFAQKAGAIHESVKNADQEHADKKAACCGESSDCC